MRPLPAALLVLALASPAQAWSVEPWPQVSLTAGEEVAIPDSEVRLRLTGITDQRCPAEVDCYWEGMIRAEISVLAPEPQTIILCNLCEDGERSATVAGVTLALMGLEPSMDELARLARPPILSDYRLGVGYAKAAP